MNLLTLSNTATELTETPFAVGMNAVFVNFTAGSLIVQGSDDNGDTDAYATFVTVPAGGMIEAGDLPRWLKVSTAATVYAIA